MRHEAHVATVDGLDESYYSVELRGRGEDCTVTLGGEVDVAALPALEDALRRALDESEHVVVAVARLTFIDAGTAAALLRAHATATARGGSLTLLGPMHPRVHALLVQTGIAPRLGID